MSEVLDSITTGGNILLLEIFISRSEASDAKTANFVYFVKTSIDFNETLHCK